MVNTHRRLKAITSLSERVAVYVPSTFNVSESVQNEKYVSMVSEKLSALFGGCTALKSHGYWMSENVGLVGEKVTVIYSYTNNLDNQKINSLLDICEWLKVEMSQEAISLEINSKLYFV